MAECYFCGDYIERGRGYRREVQIESSTRIYVSRHSGSSFGTRTALRTLCRRCAKVEDKVAQSNWLRGLGYTIGFGLSVWIGWQTIMHSEGAGLWVGLFFLLGLPVPILAWMIEGWVRTHAEDEAATSLATLDLTGTPRPSAQPILDIGKQEPVGSPAIEAGTRLEMLNEASFQLGDTIDTWATRTAKTYCMLLPQGEPLDEATFLALAWHAKPRVGEPLIDFMSRAVSRRKEWENSYQVANTEQQVDEALPDYVARASPYLVPYTPGMSLDDICPAIVELAKSQPASADEPKTDWINRVLPRTIKTILRAE